MIALVLMVAFLFIMAGVILGLAAFGVASLGTLIAIGFKIGVVLVPCLIGVSLIKWALGHI